MADRATEELYASGVDAAQVRALLRKASLEDWGAVTLDMKTAFLLAPTSKDELKAVQPPEILQEAGLTPPGAVGVAAGAMYGLTTAPRDWGIHRDATVKTMEWTSKMESGREVKLGFKQLGDANLWAVAEIAGPGVMPTQPALGCVLWLRGVLRGRHAGGWCEALRKLRLWFAVCGTPQIRNGPAAAGSRVSRSSGSKTPPTTSTSYGRETLGRNEVKTTSAFVKVWDECEDPVEVHIAQVREAQKLTGELLWLSGRTP